jgi:hypothetical protein
VTRRSIEELDGVIGAALRDSELVHEHPGPGQWLVDLPGTKKLKTVCGLVVGEHALRVEAFVCRELDRVLGSVLSYADDHFNTMLEIGFGTSIKREWDWRVKRGESLRNLEAFAEFADPARRPGAGAT